jgi:hypothetical protein
VSPPQKGSPQEALFARDKEQLRGANESPGALKKSLSEMLGEDLPG